MTTYFEYRTIDELIKDNCNFSRQQKEFTLDELSQYDGKNGKPAYVAIEGIVYDISNELDIREVKNIRIIAGKDLTEQFNFYHRIDQIINKSPRIGVLDHGEDIECEINRAAYKRSKKGTKANCKYQQCIPLNALAGLEKILQDTIIQVLELQTEILEYAGTKTDTGAATEGVGTIGGTQGNGSGVGASAVGFELAGGASGGTGGGLGAVSKNTTTLSGSGGTSSGMEPKLGPGVTGGAAGGALGGSYGGTTWRTETTNDMRNKADEKIIHLLFKLL